MRTEQDVNKPVWHIPLLCVQWKTPDDGQRNCSKHVEFYSKKKFEKLVHLVWFYYKNFSRCTFAWTSNTNTQEVLLLPYCFFVCLVFCLCVFVPFLCFIYVLVLSLLQTLVLLKLNINKYPLNLTKISFCYLIWVVILITQLICYLNLSHTTKFLLNVLLFCLYIFCLFNFCFDHFVQFRCLPLRHQANASIHENLIYFNYCLPQRLLNV